MSDSPRNEYSTLLLMLIAGICFNGTLYAFFSSIVPFSVFPILALVLAVYCLHQRYLHSAMAEGVPLLSVLSFILGIAIYSALIRVAYPSVGKNLLPVIVCLALIFWIGVKLKKVKSQFASHQNGITQ